MNDDTLKTPEAVLPVLVNDFSASLVVLPPGFFWILVLILGLSDLEFNIRLFYLIVRIVLAFNFSFVNQLANGYVVLEELVAFFVHDSDGFLGDVQEEEENVLALLLDLDYHSDLNRDGYCRYYA